MTAVSESEGTSSGEGRQDRTGRFNVALIGQTGAGKSTLANAVLGAELSPTGVGRPVTRGWNYYGAGADRFGVFDVEGIETGQALSRIIAALRAEILTRREDAPEHHVHVIWYCVQAGDHRFDDGQEAIIRALDHLGVPVVLVLTRVVLQNGELAAEDALLIASILDRGLPISPAQRVFPHDGPTRRRARRSRARARRSPGRDPPARLQRGRARERPLRGTRLTSQVGHRRTACGASRDPHGVRRVVAPSAPGASISRPLRNTTRGDRDR